MAKSPRKTAAKRNTKTKAAAKKSPTRASKRASASKSSSSRGVTVDRRTSSERRSAERRQQEAAVEDDRRQLERRVKVPRRRQIDPTTCERDYTNEEVEFMNALDMYKRRSGRMFPTCSEILEVIRDLGYCKSGAEEAVVGDATTLAVIESPTESLSELPGEKDLADLPEF